MFLQLFEHLERFRLLSFGFLLTAVVTTGQVT